MAKAKKSDKKKGNQKVYMPLMMGDWIKGTRGMRAEVKGVYIGLLIHQYDHGFIPNDVDELALIEPEVNKVWVKLKDKFEEFEPGKLRNKKCEEVRDFWTKQRINGEKGGRPKKENPKHNPKVNPEPNPDHNLNNDLDIDSDNELKNKKESTIEGDGFTYEFLESAVKVIEEKLLELDEIYLNNQATKWPHLDFDYEYRTFCEKVRGSPEFYKDHRDGGIRLAFQKQLRDSPRRKQNGLNQTTGRKQQHTANLAASVTETYRSVFTGGGNGEGGKPTT
jgi:uncharacterized protein YdaU (DUF1376 family)